MTEPAARHAADDRASADAAPARLAASRASPTLRVAGAIAADVDHESVRARRPRPPPQRRRRADRTRARSSARLRVLSLLALDFAAILGAIFTALAVKELVRGDFVFDEVMHTALDYLPFVFLVTALLFARSGLYGRREARPGLHRDRRGPVPGGVRVARCSRS